MRNKTAVGVVALAFGGLVFVPGSPGAAKKMRPEVTPEVRSEFAIFRKQYTVTPALTERLAKFVTGGKTTATARSGQLTSFATTKTPSGVEVRVVPAGDRVCLGAGDGGLSCLSADEVRAGLLTLGSLCKPTIPEAHARVVGIVPDGVTRVTAVTSDGRESLDVKNNTYVLETAEQVRRIEWQRKAQRAGFEVGLPDPSSLECAPAGGNSGDRG